MTHLHYVCQVDVIVEHHYVGILALLYRTLAIVYAHNLGRSLARHAEHINHWDLCFLDTTNAVVPDKGKKQLKQVLTEEEYSKVTANTKFKIGWYFWK